MIYDIFIRWKAICIERAVIMRGRKLYKSRDKKLCGVCGGIAEYFGIDPTIVRIIYAALVFFGGVGVLPYIIAAVIMDDAPLYYKNDVKKIETKNYFEPNSFSEKPYYESEEPIGFTLNSDNITNIR
ncbi:MULTISPECIES: PspC domain-containing protein [unclassified Butyrivibrio]|uniref:PspC domain-containing protein n=1 Tax=unclassified Butyrivibrio TaxID=2639466 RepID=UPI002E8E09C3|nr:MULTISPECIES: PspC domain-containing protein [unclassified Butyrivibrio]